jgi:tubulin-specific chaperone A
MKQTSRSSAGMDVSALKSLKMKMGVCKRVMKELQSYEQEVEREFAKTENMKNAQACPFDIKQQVALIAHPRKCNCVP